MLSKFVIGVLDYISWPEFRDSESRFFNRDGRLCSVFCINPYENGSDESAFSDLVDICKTLREGLMMSLLLQLSYRYEYI